jgi:hypothetical protein
VREIRHAVDVNTLAHRPAQELRLNDIGVVSIESQQPLFFDPYRGNRATGSFILIDPLSNRTVAAGMIRHSGYRQRAEGPVTAGERQARFGHPALTIHLENCAPELPWLLEQAVRRRTGGGWFPRPRGVSGSVGGRPDLDRRRNAAG